MINAWIVREKGYEYNDNWYDLDESYDKYTELYMDKLSADLCSKQKTADFISNRRIYEYFNEQPYLRKLMHIAGGDEFGQMIVGDIIFESIYDIIKDDMFEVLETEVEGNDPYVAILPNGSRLYYKNDVLHRRDMPAYITPNGQEEWYLNGKLHRLDGPAKTSYQEGQYYIDGNSYWDMKKFETAKLLWIQENREEKLNNIV